LHLVGARLLTSEGTEHYIDDYDLKRRLLESHRGGGS